MVDPYGALADGADAEPQQTPGEPLAAGERIGPNSELPAERRPVTLHTADGLRLEGQLAVPAAAPVRATLVCLHPLPTHGGSLDSHLYRKAAWRLPALADVAVLRFNFRGTGRSEGTFEGGEGEKWDLAAALDLVEAEELPDPWLVGWSFGSEVLLRYGWQDPTVAGGIALSPPLKRATDADLAAWDASGKPLVALVPEHDDYLRPAQAAPRFGRVRNCSLVAVEGAKHLWVGARYADRVLNEIIRAVRPEAYPLPEIWTG